MPTMTRSSFDAPLDLEKGAIGVKASSDSLVDVEKVLTGTKAATATEEEEDPAAVDSRGMDPRLAMCIKVSLFCCLFSSL